MVYYGEGKEHPANNRIALLRQKMMENNIDYCLIPTGDPHLSEYVQETDRVREYFSGFTGSAGTLLVGSNEAYLWTDSRYYIQAEEELSGSDIVLMRDGIKEVPSIDDFLSSNLWEGQSIAFDFKTIRASSYEKYKDLLGGCIEIIDAAKIIRESFVDRPKREFRPVILIDENQCGKTHEEKIAQIRKLIDKKLNDSEASYTYIISDLCSIMWICNLRGEDVTHVPVAFSYLCIDRFCTTIYLNKKNVDLQVREGLSDRGIIVKEYGTFYNELGDIATDYVLLDKTKNNACILNKASDFSEIFEVKDFDFIKKYIKNEKEIAGMKKAHINDAKVCISFIRKIKQLVNDNGEISEFQAAKMLDDMRLSQEDCFDISFDTICGYGANGAIVHYEADEEKCARLESKGFVLIDSGGHYNCGTTDITRTIALGDLSDKEKEVYTLVLKANISLYMARFKDDVRGDNLDILARSPIWNGGYDYGHGTGHGIGCRLSVHEDPIRISYKNPNGGIFEPGVIVSDEPGIYLKGEFGVRLENILLVVKDDSDSDFCHFECLTLVPFDKDAIIPEMLTEKEKDTLNRYHSDVYEIMTQYLDEDDKIWLLDATKPIV